jgi:hypothetical protein
VSVAALTFDRSPVSALDAAGTVERTTASGSRFFGALAAVPVPGDRGVERAGGRGGGE